MAAKRSPPADSPPPKRQKTANGTVDPRDNPYLQHMFTDEGESSYAAYTEPPKRLNGAVGGDPFSQFRQHETTAKMARRVEDGQSNPFTGAPFSSRYISIMKARRDLPVHAQRFAPLAVRPVTQLTFSQLGMNFYRCTKSPRYWSLLARQGLERRRRYHNLSSTMIYRRDSASLLHVRSLAG